MIARLPLALLSLGVLLVPPPSSGQLPPERLQFVTLGDSFLLPCPVIPGERWNRITWEDALGRYVGRGPFFSLQAASMRDAGRYVCRKIRWGTRNSQPVLSIHVVRLVVLPSRNSLKEAPLVPPDMRSNATSQPVTVSAQVLLQSQNTGQPVELQHPSQPTRQNYIPPDRRPQATRRVFTPPIWRRQTTRRIFLPSQRPPRSSSQVSVRPSMASADVSRGVCLNGEGVCEIWKGSAPSRRCISRSWVCDGEDDCGNGWDERNCSISRQCQSLTFACSQNGNKIPIAWRCDGDVDCRNRADEIGCVRATFVRSDTSPAINSIRADPGQLVRLECSARGLPRPLVTWTKNSNVIRSTRNQCSLGNGDNVFLVKSDLEVRVPSRMEGVHEYECVMTQHGSRVGVQRFVISARN